MTSVSVTGRHAGDFPIRRSGCGGALSSEGCEVRVGFVPRGPGPRHANLRVATTAGTTNVSLDGAGAPGRTDWILDVDYEDPSRPDEHLELPYSFAWGLPYELGSQAYGADGIVWDAFFDLAGNATFSEGRYDYNPDGTGLQMQLSRGNEGCELDRAGIDVPTWPSPARTIAWRCSTSPWRCTAAPTTGTPCAAGSGSRTATTRRRPAP